MKKSKNQILLFIITINHRKACSINDGSSVVITGGYQNDVLATVTRYSLYGFEEDLPDLNIARKFHACGGFNTESGARVGILL